MAAAARKQPSRKKRPEGKTKTEPAKELQALPGVGKYMAHAVLSAAFGMRVEILDTNVVRILGRYFGVFSERPRPRTDPELWAISRLLTGE